MKEIQRFFYDTNGKKIEDKKDVIHDEIAKKIIANNPEYLEEYNDLKKNSNITESIFLVLKGYLYVGGTDVNDMLTIYSSISLNEITREILGEYKAVGYSIYDIIRQELTDEEKKQIKSWARDGMPRSEIIKKVTKEMIATKGLIEVKNNDNKKDDNHNER